GKIVEGAPLDEKLYGLKGIELISIATLSGRVTIPFRVAGYGAEWNGKSPARLVARKGVDARHSVQSHPHPNPPPKSGEREYELLIAVGLSVVEGMTASG